VAAGGNRGAMTPPLLSLTGLLILFLSCTQIAAEGKFPHIPYLLYNFSEGRRVTNCLTSETRKSRFSRDAMSTCASLSQGVLGIWMPHKLRFGPYVYLEDGCSVFLRNVSITILIMTDLTFICW
jgi:hypothetical protein